MDSGARGLYQKLAQCDPTKALKEKAQLKAQS